MSTNLAVAAYDLPAVGLRGLDCLTKDLQTDEKRASATGILAAASIDRIGDRIKIAGIILDAHRKNPTALFQHGFSRSDDGILPIGQYADPETNEYGVKLYPEKGLCVGTTWFHQKTLLSAQICALVMSRDIRAQSVGYVEEVSRRFEDDRFVGTDLDSIELVEGSWCVTPMNGECVRSILSRNVAGKALVPSLKSALQQYAGASPIWSPGVTITGAKNMANDNGNAADDGDDGGGLEEKRAVKTCRTLNKCYTRAKRLLTKEMSVAEDGDCKEMLDAHLGVLEKLHDGVKALHEAKADENAEPLESEDEIKDLGDGDDDSGGDEGGAMDESEKAARAEIRRMKLGAQHRLRLQNAKSYAGRR